MKNLKTFEEKKYNHRKVVRSDDLEQYYEDFEFSEIIKMYDVNYSLFIAELYDIKYVIVDIYDDLILLLIKDNYVINVADDFNRFINKFDNLKVDETEFIKRSNAYIEIMILYQKFLGNDIETIKQTKEFKDFVKKQNIKKFKI